MIKRHIKTLSAIAIAVLCQMTAQAQLKLDYTGSFTANIGDSELAPYYIASNRGGTVTQQYSSLVSASMWHVMDTTKRISYGFGAEAWSGYTSSASYQRYNPDTEKFYMQPQHPARIWMEQIYAEGKYRSVFLTLGMKRHYSPFLNTALSSGDLIMSGNARPATGVNSGFVNFQNIPFTKGWVQIIGEMGFYRVVNGNWLANHFNHYNYYLTTNYWFNYKNIYFRTQPGHPFTFTIGAQAACQFGGNNTIYDKGRITKVYKMRGGIKEFFRSLIAGKGGNNPGDEAYVEGNHLGSWDIILEYKLHDASLLRAYYQTPWEDGSGIGKLNGFDGLWGIEFRNGSKSIVNGAVIEYIDLTNQSGPLHWDPADISGTTLSGHTTGSDDYYNNFAYNGYQAFGMSIGSPFVKSPIYNTDGYMRFTDNVIRGFHAGITGNFTGELQYRALVSYRHSWGTPFLQRLKPASDTSMMLEATYSPRWLHGLEMKAQFALDRGSLYGNNVGQLISITYNGNLTLRK